MSCPPKRDAKIMQSKRNSKQKPKDFFFELQRHVDFGLEIDLESQTQKFVELEV